MEIPCVLVTPKRKLAGRLAIMKKILRFFGEYLVEGTGGSSVLRTFYSSGSLITALLNTLEDLRGRNNDRKQHKSIKRHRCWNISKIKAVHWTRYLLRYTAIEIFFVNSMAPIFLNFASQKDAKDVGRRSYNDLTQYPVFPWVLADYSSETLDLKKSSTFRDLSKPVGALDPKRFQVFEDRYHNFVDLDIPSFYYGSHYSSMGIVLFYLLRLEPFTALHRSLQGGKFDHADRLFQSIESTFKNCLSNTSDVKELIPEFFYMPEFLINSNLYHFGVKQDGEPIADVCLPPWAKAANIFYYLTYEGAVDLDNMEDDLQRSAIEDQIANFGQTPIQIFRKKHPRRGPPIPIAHPLRFAPGSISLTSVVPSKQFYFSSDSGGNFTFSGSQEPFFGIGSDVLSPCKIRSPLVDNFDLGAECFATLQTPSENFLISCGNWENSFQVSSLNDGRMVQSVRHHKDVVSCIAVTADGSILATGSYDTTVMVWEVLRVRGTEKRSRNTRIEIPWKDSIIADTPFHILCGHDDVITCLYANDLSLHLYSINGRHISTAESNGRLSCLALSSCGDFLVCGGDQGQIIIIILTVDVDIECSHPGLSEVPSFSASDAGFTWYHNFLAAVWALWSQSGDFIAAAAQVLDSPHSSSRKSLVHGLQILRILLLVQLDLGQR
ncbi:UNVERIFIED_CONTAM: BEACH domain-containing protein B [Sesamum radiatum]|uniref:BEACH domain-containing protein B n=1 Tax=Sesamum radiatum TaxID=300843 RepID=A0AAW2SIW9_SESRA